MSLAQHSGTIDIAAHLEENMAAATLELDDAAYTHISETAER